MGALEEALMLAIGAGEAALLVAEDLAFDQVGRDRAAVDCQERVLAATAEVMHGLRHHFLAGAALAGDEHRNRRDGNARDLFVDAAHRCRTAPKMTEMTGGLPFGGERGQLGLDRRRPHHARQDALQLLHVDGLDEIVGRAHAQRLDRALEAGVAGDQHDLGVGHELRVLEQVHAAAVGQLQIQQHQVGQLQHDLAAGVPHRPRNGDGEALSGDQGRHRLGGVGVVFDDQRMGHGSEVSSGNRSARRARAGSATEVPANRGGIARRRQHFQ